MQVLMNNKNKQTKNKTTKRINRFRFKPQKLFMNIDYALSMQTKY